MVAAFHTPEVRAPTPVMLAKIPETRFALSMMPSTTSKATLAVVAVNAEVAKLAVVEVREVVAKSAVVVVSAAVEKLAVVEVKAVIAKFAVEAIKAKSAVDAMFAVTAMSAMMPVSIEPSPTNLFAVTVAEKTAPTPVKLPVTVRLVKVPILAVLLPMGVSSMRPFTIVRLLAI